MRPYAGWFVALAASACASVPPPTPASPAARQCSVAPAAPGGVLSAALVRTLHDESAPVIAHAVCACADELGVASLPSAVRTSAILVPARGAIVDVRPLADAAGVIVDTEGTLDACIARRAASARLPAHVIGSDVQPDPDPTDERVVMSVFVHVDAR